MSVDRRRSARVVVNCEMAIKLDGETFNCQVRNIAGTGVLARVHAGNTLRLNELEEVGCWLEYQGKGFEAWCRVVRVTGWDVALLFLDLGKEQMSFLEEITKESPQDQRELESSYLFE